MKVHSSPPPPLLPLIPLWIIRNLPDPAGIETDGPTGRQTDRQTDRQAGRQTDRQIDRRVMGYLGDEGLFCSGHWRGGCVTRQGHTPPRGGAGPVRLHQHTSTGLDQHYTPSLAFRHLPPQSLTLRASLSGTFLHSHSHTPSIAFRHLPPQSLTHSEHRFPAPSSKG